jgi:2-polyprenyl-3-methyl-5-hydroxy-6-metoxy-1,4-benzoquinol methylase
MKVVTIQVLDHSDTMTVNTAFARSEHSCIGCGARGYTRFIERAGYEIVRCDSCGLRFLHPQPSAAEVQAYYDKEYFGSGNSANRGYDAYLTEAENHRATFRNRLRLLPRPSPDARLLDVGAATGFFVEQARIAGWNAEGVEPSEWAATYASKQLGQPVLHGTLEDAHFSPDTFDIVTLWEVIEHLPDPRAFLMEVARVLRPGGFLALSTPDAGSMVARVFRKRWLGWSKVPEHLFFFDRANLERILVDTGFVVQSCRYVSITVTAEFAARRLGTLLGLPALARLPSRLARRALAVNPLYDLMIIARRRQKA